MHETNLFKNIPGYLTQEETSLGKDIKKLYVTISEFGSFSEAHVREHFTDTLRATKWASLDITVITIPFGPEFEITKIEFE